MKFVARFFFVTILFFFCSPGFPQDNQTISGLESKAAQYEKDGNTLELARCQIKIGFLYNESNNIPKALEFLLKAVKSNESLGNLNAVKNLCTNIGMIYSQSNNDEQAIDFFKKSLKINEKQGKKPDIVADLINIALAQQSGRNYTESNQNLDKAATIAQELTDMVSLKNIYGTLSENYDKLGNADKSKEYFELASTIKSHMQKEEIKNLGTRTK